MSAHSPVLANFQVAQTGLAVSPGSALPPVLDACCGSRMFWFDRADPRAIFIDRRRETHELPDKSSKGGKRTLIVNPDIVADFTALPFADESFALVSFDPPHFERNGAKGWVGLKYGTLTGDWREMLRKGFAECFRVLKHEGVLVFKWCEDEIPVSQILALTPERPLFGNRCGKNAKTHWVVFMKQDTKMTHAAQDSSSQDQRPPALCPAPGSAFTRERWLAYRVVAEIHRHGLDIETSPAVKVWGVVEAEIVRWMQQHGITPSLPAMAQEPSDVHEPTRRTEPRIQK